MTVWCISPRCSERYLKHPSEVLSVGDVVQVAVIDVDVAKKRISLSMKKEDFAELKRGEALVCGDQAPQGALSFLGYLFHEKGNWGVRGKAPCRCPQTAPQR